MKPLNDKTVLVTGASGDIGYEIVRAIGALGGNVIAQWGNNLDRAISATAHIPAERKLLIHSDFSEEGSADRLWEEAVAWRGRVDVFVNNAAVMPEAGFDEPDHIWDEALSLALGVNVVQPMKLLNRAVNHFSRLGGGIIVTMSSWSSQRGSGNSRLAAYAASKAATATATKTIARAYARENILAYCIAPGPVDTRMTHQSALSQGGLDEVRESLTIGDLVPPKELAEIVCFLARGSARHLTGATLDVNGATYIR